jgi:hypothetical protein
MYIDFIQSSSFNLWIKINFDSKFNFEFQNVVVQILKFFAYV